MNDLKVFLWSLAALASIGFLVMHAYKKGHQDGAVEMGLFCLDSMKKGSSR